MKFVLARSIRRALVESAAMDGRFLIFAIKDDRGIEKYAT